jgi:hypothetical protein
MEFREVFSGACPKCLCYCGWICWLSGISFYAWGLNAFTGFSTVYITSSSSYVCEACPSCVCEGSANYVYEGCLHVSVYDFILTQADRPQLQVY